MYHPTFPQLGLWVPHAVCPPTPGPAVPSAPRWVAPVPGGELPFPALPLPALPNNGGPVGLGWSFEFKRGQALVYKNNKPPSNRVM